MTGTRPLPRYVPAEESPYWHAVGLLGLLAFLTIAGIVFAVGLAWLGLTVEQFVLRALT